MMDKTQMIEKMLRFIDLSTEEEPEEIKLLLGDIIDLAESRLKGLLGKDTIPTELEYIIFEVGIIRYNRLGSEGMASEAIEGYSTNFVEDEFQTYLPIIEKYREPENDGWTYGEVEFL